MGTQAINTAPLGSIQAPRFTEKDGITYIVPSTPSAGLIYLYPKIADHQFYILDSTGTESQLLSTSVASVKDSVFRITGSADTTKKAAFEVDGFTTATTRTFTLHNVSETLLGDASQIITTLTTEQMRLRYDASNYFTTTVSSAGNTTFASSAAGGLFIFSTTGAVTLAAGTTAQQPGSPTAGMVRYNSTTSRFEFYSSAWKNHVRLDGDTMTGNLGIGTAPSVPLHVLSTTEAVRIAFDASNYMAITMGGTGNATIAPTGSTVNFGNSTTGTIFVFTGKSGTSNNLSFDNATDSNPDITLSSTSDRYLNIVNSNTGTFGLIVEGKVSVFQTSTPTAYLHIAAGTTAASTAPIKLTTGTSMTAAEAGAIEYTTDDLFFTISTGTARVRFLFADPTGGLTSGRVPFATTNGRLTDGAGLTYAAASGLTILQATLGNAVQALSSTATNDDPTETIYQNRVATTDATVTTLHTFTVPASTTYQIVATVTARRTGGASGSAEDGAGYVIVGTYKNVAGTATIIGAVTAVSTQEDQAAWDATFDVTGATVRVRITGAASNNIVWHMTARVYQVGT